MSVFYSAHKAELQSGHSPVACQGKSEVMPTIVVKSWRAELFDVRITFSGTPSSFVASLKGKQESIKVGALEGI